MPAKLSTIAYVHESTERLTQDFTVKEITAMSRLSDDDLTKVIYLRIKAFIPSNRDIETQIEEFETGDVIFLRGKFIACAGWYSVNATSIKVLGNLDFGAMPSVGLSITAVGITTKTVRNIDGKHHLEFYIEENLGEREPREFWVDVTYDPNIRYLANKVNSINQTMMRSTTAVLVGLIAYEPPVYDEITQEEKAPGKHVVRLEDISLVSTRNNNNNNNIQSGLNLPWLQGNSSSSNNRSNRTPRGATPRSRRGRPTLSQMESTRTRLSEVLESNPVPAGMIAATTNAGTDTTDATDATDQQDQN